MSNLKRFLKISLARPFRPPPTLCFRIVSHVIRTWYVDYIPLIGIWIESCGGGRAVYRWKHSVYSEYNYRWDAVCFHDFLKRYWLLNFPCMKSAQKATIFKFPFCVRPFTRLQCIIYWLISFLWCFVRFVENNGLLNCISMEELTKALMPLDNGLFAREHWVYFRELARTNQIVRRYDRSLTPFLSTPRFNRFSSSKSPCIKNLTIIITADNFYILTT